MVKSGVAGIDLSSFSLHFYRQKTSNNWKYYGDDMFEKEDYKHTSNGYYT